MKYELDLFFRIIHGDLLPESNEKIGFKDHITFLQDRFEQCIKHYKIQFKQNTSGGYALQHFDEYAFLDLAGMLYQDASPDSDAQLLDEIIAQSLSFISIDRESIRKAQYVKNKKELELEITVQVDFTHLKPEEARFHYYRTLLHDEAERIKRSFHNQSFRLQSEKQIELFIQNHQLALETLTQSLLGYLDEQDRKNLYSISRQYSLTRLLAKVERSCG